MVFCFAVLLAVTSCSDVNDKMLDMIEEDAAFVVSVKPSAMIEHFDVQMDKDNKIVLPEFLRNSMTESDKKRANEVLDAVAKMGFDPKSNIYFFVPADAKIKNSSPENFSLVMMFAVDDDDDAKRAIENMPDTKISYTKQDDMFLYEKKDNFLGTVIKDNVVMFAFGDNIDMKKMANKFFEHDYKSIRDNDKAKSFIDSDDDFNIYMNYEKIVSWLKQGMNEASLQNSVVAQYFTLISDFWSAIGAMNINVNFADNQVKVKSEIVLNKDGGDYEKLMKSIIAEPSANFLNVMPADLNGVFTMNVNGPGIVALSQVSTLLTLFSGQGTFDELGGIKGLIESIKGAIAIGFVTDFEKNHVGFTVAIETSKATQLLAFIEKMTQEMPLKKLNNELLYEDGSNRVSMGNKGNFLYVKYEPVTTTTSKMGAGTEQAKKFFSSTSLGGYYNLPAGDMTMHFDTKMIDFTHSEATFCIKKNDKNMKFFDYGNYFSRLMAQITVARQLFNQFYPQSASYDEEDYGTTYGDDENFDAYSDDIDEV